MIKKIFFLILALIAISPSFYSPKSAFAIENCFDGVSYSYNPANIAGRKTFTVRINGTNNLPVLTDASYYLEVRYDTLYSGGRIFKFSADKTSTVVAGVSPFATANNTPIQKINIRLAILAIRGNQVGTIYGGSILNKTCTETFSVGEPVPTPEPADGTPTGDSCKVSFIKDDSKNYGLKPTNLIAIKANDIGGNDGDGKGVTVLDKKTNQELLSTCTNVQTLKNNYQLVQRNGISTFGSGSYTLRIFDQCTIFGTPEPSSKLICQTPHTFSVDPNGGADKTIVKGSACNPKDANPCGNPGASVAPFCNPDLKNPGHYTCSDIQPVTEKCKNGSCETAIGSVSYTPEGFLKSALSLIFSLAGGILLVFLILNGYRLAVSQGDPEKIKEARESIMSAIAGLFMVIASLAILQLVTVNILQLPGFK